MCWRGTERLTKRRLEGLAALPQTWKHLTRSVVSRRIQPTGPGSPLLEQAWKHSPRLYADERS